MMTMPATAMAIAIQVARRTGSPSRKEEHRTQATVGYEETLGGLDPAADPQTEADEPGRVYEY